MSDEKKPESTRLTFILVALILLIFAATGFLWEKKNPDEVSEDKIAWGTVFLSAGISGIVAGGICFLAGLHVAAKNYNKSNNVESPVEEAGALTALGQFSKAAQIYDEELDNASKTDSPLRAVALSNKATLHLHKGEWEDAYSLIEEALRINKMEKQVLSVSPYVITNLHLLKIEILVYKGALTDVDRELTDLPSANIEPIESSLEWIQLLIALRKGNFKQVLDLLHGNSLSNNGRKTQARFLAQIKIFRAFALNNLVQSESTQIECANLIGGAWPARPEWFTYITKEWPELRSFISKNEPRIFPS